MKTEHATVDNSTGNSVLSLWCCHHFFDHKSWEITGYLHGIKANICHLSRAPFSQSSRQIYLEVLQPIVLLGQKYFISFTISLSQSQLLKPQTCRFRNVSGVKLKPSGSLHKCKETWCVLLALQNHFRGITFHLSCGLVLGAEPRQQGSCRHLLGSAVGAYRNLLHGFLRRLHLSQRCALLPSEFTKCFETVGEEVF